jgi:DnaJ-domain-containing protein 1
MTRPSRAGQVPQSHYDTLRVAREAAPEAVRRAYRRQAQKWHPDRAAGDPAAPQRMAEINAAYAVLSHPGLRASYDQWLQARQSRLAAERAVHESRSARLAPWPWWLLCATLCFASVSIGTVLYKMAVPVVAAPAHKTR